MQSMKIGMKLDSFVSSNMLPVRAPNNGNDTIDNNQTLPEENDTYCNANTSSPDVSWSSGLRRSTKVGKKPSYMKYVYPKTGVK